MSALHVRQFAADSEEMLPVLSRRAELLNGMGRYQDERLVYLDIVRIIEGHRGEADVSLIEPYTALGRTSLHEVGEVIFRSEPTAQTGETYLKKAVEVAQTSPDADWLMQEQALIELADYYTILDVQDKARQNYRTAWELLSSDEGLEQRRKDLEIVMPLVRPKLDLYANFGYRGGGEDPDPAEHIEGYIVAQFTVNERGRVTDIRPYGLR
jgi:tetratricopeptide (TPR) repeat protein